MKSAAVKTPAPTMVETKTIDTSELASRTSAYPVVTEQPAKIWVDDETGAVLDDPSKLGPRGGRQLVGVDADAYKAGKSSSSGKTADKMVDDGMEADTKKQRKASGDKALKVKSATKSKSK